MPTSSTGARLSAWLSRHPYQTLLIAAGVGYVVAGGLFTRLTFNALRVGMRVGALPILQRELLGLADTTLGVQPDVSSPAHHA